LVRHEQDTSLALIDVDNAPKFRNWCAASQVASEGVHRVAKASKTRAIERVLIGVNHQVGNVAFVTDKTWFQRNSAKVWCDWSWSGHQSIHGAQHGKVAEPRVFKASLSQGVIWANEGLNQVDLLR
jgi:hypothetical protein